MDLYGIIVSLLWVKAIEVIQSESAELTSIEDEIPYPESV